MLWRVCNYTHFVSDPTAEELYKILELLLRGPYIYFGLFSLSEYPRNEKLGTHGMQCLWWLAFPKNSITETSPKYSQADWKFPITSALQTSGKKVSSVVAAALLKPHSTIVVWLRTSSLRYH